MSDEIERLQRRLEREREARKTAERLLEEKSRALFDANQALQRMANSLEAQVHARTAELSQALEATESANRLLRETERVQAHQIFAIDQHCIASATDRAGRIVYANDRFVEISGYGKDELMGASHRLVNSGIHPRELFVTMWQTIAQGQVWKGEICNRHKNGNLYWVSATIVPFLDESGRPYQYFSIRTDITPLKEAQRKLQQTVVDMGERVKEWRCLNAVTHALQDDALTDEQALQAVARLIPPGWLVPEETHARVRRGDVTCLSDGFLQSPWRLSASSADFGQLIEVDVFRTLQDMEDEPFLPEEQTLLDSIAMQIGQALARREAQRELLLARDAAEAASTAKGVFLANMSHEIRTPMNGIIGMSQLALEATSDVERREHIGIVKASAESLLDIINDILDFSKIEAGKLEIERVVFDLRSSISLGMHALRMRAEEKGVALRFDVPTDLPTEVVGDPTRLRQILINLVGNAIKFTAKGEVRVAVALLAREADTQRFQFTVTDTGIGIRPEQMDHIFEAFAQADTSTTRQFGGTGLGLTITQKLVTLMGGVLRVRSEVGRGSQFEVALPFDVPRQAADAPSLRARSADTADAAASAGSLRVLLVEDHPVNQKLAKHLLERWGHEVTLAQNGQEAVDAVATKPPFEMVLMDMQMPVMGGVEATRLIRALEVRQGRPAVPIIAMTANAMASDREECLEAGMNDYLSKPMRQAELSEKLRRWAPSSPLSISHP